MNKLRHDVYQILGIPIYEGQGGWGKTIEELNAQGRIDFKTMLNLFIIVARHVEELEKKDEPSEPNPSLQPPQN